MSIITVNLGSKLPAVQLVYSPDKMFPTIKTNSALTEQQYTKIINYMTQEGFLPGQVQTGYESVALI